MNTMNDMLKDEIEMDKLEPVTGGGSTFDDDWRFCMDYMNCRDCGTPVAEEYFTPIAENIYVTDNYYEDNRVYCRKCWYEGRKVRVGTRHCFAG